MFYGLNTFYSAIGISLTCYKIGFYDDNLSTLSNTGDVDSDLGVSCWQRDVYYRKGLNLGLPIFSTVGIELSLVLGQNKILALLRRSFHLSIAFPAFIAKRPIMVDAWTKSQKH